MPKASSSASSSKKKGKDQLDNPSKKRCKWTSDSDGKLCELLIKEKHARKSSDGGFKECIYCSVAETMTEAGYDRDLEQIRSCYGVASSPLVHHSPRSEYLAS
jgi:hypothetical protein